MTTRSRADTLPLVGGLAVVDLVNTISWRGAPERGEDHLLTADDCVMWAVRAGVLSSSEGARLRRHLREPQSARTLVRELRRLRTVVAEALVTPDRETMAAAQSLIIEAMRGARLVPTGPALVVVGHRWAVETVDEHVVARRLALQLSLLLTQPSGRIGVCADADCQWVFLDVSRGGNRRWCDSRDCGNRHRVRQHQLRRA